MVDVGTWQVSSADSILSDKSYVKDNNLPVKLAVRRLALEVVG